MAVKSNRYIYFQPNKKDIKDNFGDCAIRSICRAENIDWLTAYDLMWKISRQVQSPMNCKYGFEHIVKTLGYKYQGVSNKKGTKRPTVDSFASEHKKGTYICVVANHYVTIVDGYFYDTWDSGKRSLYGVWLKESTAE